MAQGWERTYGGIAEEGAFDIQLTNDGGYIVSGYTESYGAGMYDMYAVKIDANGDTLWTRSYGKTQGDQAFSGFQTSDGGYFLGGNISTSTSSDFYLCKLDANGDSTWTKTHTVTGYGGARDAQQTTDGGYILAGYANNDAHIIKTDALGDTLWTRVYGNSIQQDVFEAVSQTTDGGYIFAGESKHVITNTQIYLVKTNANGDHLWTKSYGHIDVQKIWDVEQTSDGGYILIGIGASPYHSSSIIISKTDSLGNELWGSTYSGRAFSIKETMDGNYVLVGTSMDGKNLLIKINATGSELWRKTYASGEAHQVHQTTDGGYIFSGSASINNGITDMYVVKTDSLGNSLTNHIRGNVFQDNNTDCVLNSGDIDLTGTLISATHSNGRIYHGTTDALGYYNIICEPGNYIVSISNIGAYYNTTCGQSISSNLPNVFDIDTIDFALDPAILCPLLYVDLSAPFIRQTNNGSSYTVNYCNQGTVDAQNAYVEVEIDPALTVLGSSIPINNQNNNTYTFLLGNVPIGQCASFTINVIASISAIAGQTFCSEAHIYPDSICIPHLWNGPILEVDVNCINDTVHFEIQNIGSPMAQSLQYFVYEDNIIFSIGNTNPLGTFGTQTIKEIAAVGKSYRICVHQPVGFPSILGDSIATASVEGCNPDPSGNFNTGFITQLSNGNSAPSIAVDCQQMVGSYDPNDKSAQPEGYSSQHYIEAHIGLDYKIRFQNTGTDTAFSVVLRDTISPYLDLSSIEMGASSHPYTWRIYGQRILEIKFSPIALPDSTTNELASHGFVRFRINQENNNSIGTRIENTVGIYFDYNAPIITNTTWHTIGENFVPIIVSIGQINTPNTNVTVFPNPFNQATNIQVEGADYQSLTLSVFDAMGRLVYNTQSTGNSIELLRGNLAEGLYFYRLEGDQKLINTGKITVRN
jgi:hypothetical protein